MATGLDHIGIVGGDLAALEDAYRQLGFTVAPRTELVALAGDGSAQPLGQANSHLVFANTYVELTAVHGDLEHHHLRDAIARYFGFHIVVLTTADADATRSQLRTAGVDAPEVATAGRDIRYPSGHGMAGFRWFRVPEQELPEAFVCFVEQLNPDLVFDAALNTHPNGARELLEIVLCVDDPAASADRLGKTTGGQVLETVDGRVIDLAPGRIRVLDSNQLAERYPGVRAPGLPWAAGFSLLTEDIDHSERVMRDLGAPVNRSGPRVWVSPEAAGGAIVEFVEAG